METTESNEEKKSFQELIQERAEREIHLEDLDESIIWPANWIT